MNNGNTTVNRKANFSNANITSIIIVGEMFLVPKKISVDQLFSVVPVLICEITVFTVKTLEKNSNIIPKE